MYRLRHVPLRIFHSVGAAESALYWYKASFSDENAPLELTRRGGVSKLNKKVEEENDDREMSFERVSRMPHQLAF